jgi:uracil-DNA glycosylase family protein
MIREPGATPQRRVPKAVALQPGLTLRSDGIHSLEELKAATMRCRECPIGETATQSVNGEGRLHAPLMFVGEQPGDQEDLQGHPFIGPAGHLLDRALEAIGVPRDAVFVSNAVKHFKFELRGKRRIHKSPSQREAAACLHWLEDEIALVKPKALVALGATAARSLLGYQVPVTAERGKWLERADGLKVLITLHPSALLRMPPEDKQAGFAALVADLKKVRKVIG